MQKNKKISEELKTEMHELHRDFHDLYPLHTPSNEEDRETGFGSVATEEEKADPVEGEENFVGDSEIIALGGASNETKDRPLG